MCAAHLNFKSDVVGGRRWSSERREFLIDVHLWAALGAPSLVARNKRSPQIVLPLLVALRPTFA